MTFETFRHARFGLHFAAIIILSIGALLGMRVGAGNFGQFGYLVAAIAFLVYACFFVQSTWKIGLFLFFLDFFHTGFGFRITATEMGLFVTCLLLGVTWWRKTKIERPAILSHWSFALVNLLLLGWLVYAIGHTIFNVLTPYSPQDYAFKNLIKTAVSWTAPYLTLLCFINRPVGFEVKRGFVSTIAKLLLFGVVVNVAIALFQQFTGAAMAGDIAEEDAGGFYIPYLEVQANVYALRFLGAFGALFFSTMVTSRTFGEQTFGTKVVCWVGLPLSCLGALLSGGRLTLGFATVFMFIILVLRKKMDAIFASVLIALLTFAGANLFPDVVYSAPTPVKRSMQWMMLTKDYNALGDIDGSTRWRKEIFRAALDEWKSDPRIFWFGRATYSFNVADQVGIKLRGWEGFLESSLRRGATHNLVTDMLVTFGLVGATIYMFLSGMITAFLWRLWKYPRNSDEGTDLALVCLIFHVFNFSYGLIGGSNFPAALAWLITSLVAYHYFTFQPQSTIHPVNVIGRPTRPLLRGPAQPVFR